MTQHPGPQQSSQSQQSQQQQDSISPHYRHQQPQQSSGCMKYAVIGCLGIILLGVILGCLGGIWAYKNGRGWMANAVSQTMQQAVNELNLPDDQSQAIEQQLDQIATLYAEGHLSTTDAAELMQRIQQSPVFAAGMTQMFHARFLTPSGLSEQEKADGAAQLARVGQGLYAQQVSEEEAAPLTDMLFIDAGQRRRIRETMTDAQVRQFLLQAKELADRKNLPPGRLESIDYATGLQKVVNDFLAEKGVKVPPTEP